MEQECPICLNFFSIDLINKHANECLSNSSLDKSKQKNEIETKINCHDVENIIPRKHIQKNIVNNKDNNETINKSSNLKKRNYKQTKIEQFSQDNFFKNDDSKKHIKIDSLEENEFFKKKEDFTPIRKVLTSDKQNENKEKKYDFFIPLFHSHRPKTLKKFYGHKNLLNENGILKSIYNKNFFMSILLWGPSGVGKTTLAKILGSNVNFFFVELSSIDNGTKSLKEVSVTAEKNKKLTNKKTILLLDHIHRFNKLFQETLLYLLEKNHFYVIGVTTENPSFNIFNSLLSRFHVFIMMPLLIEDNLKILEDGLILMNKMRKYLFDLESISLTNESLNYIAKLSSGNAFITLNILDFIKVFFYDNESNNLEQHKKNIDSSKIINISLNHLKFLLKGLKFCQFYDKHGDFHFDSISAFHKSIRGSDPDAALFYLQKMLVSGEDPLIIIRRLIVIASEDIGVGDSRCLPFVMAAKEAFEFVGQPEGEIILAHCVIKLANAFKSTKSYRALKNVQSIFKNRTEIANIPIPLHLRNAPTNLMKKLGHGNSYKYNPHYENGIVKQSYMPDQLKEIKFVESNHLGNERDPEIDPAIYENVKKELNSCYGSINLKKKNYHTLINLNLNNEIKLNKNSNIENSYNNVKDDLFNNDGHQFSFEEEEKQEYSDDPDCTNNFGQSYDEFFFEQKCNDDYISNNDT